MSGHVFHPGHHRLHGITVVVDASGGRTYVGRFDRAEDGKVLLLNVAVHDPSGAARDEFLGRSHKFGVKVDLKHLAIPEAEISGIVPLADLAP